MQDYPGTNGHRCGWK